MMAVGIAGMVGISMMGCGSSKSSDSGESKSTASAKSDGGEVNLIIWTEYLPEDLIAKFEEETGIKVNVTYYSSSDEMVAKVTASSPDTSISSVMVLSIMMLFVKKGS